MGGLRTHYNQDDARAEIDTLLTQTFNSVLRTEEEFLVNKLIKGLTITEIHTIVAVGLNEVNPMKVVAERLGITLATLTTAVTRLVEKGYIERERSESDRRQVLISLTREGKQVFRAHRAFHEHMVDEALAGLSLEEQQVLAQSLIRVKDFFDKQADSAH